MTPPSLLIAPTTYLKNANHLSLIASFTLIGRIRKYIDVRSVNSLVHALILRRIDFANSLLFGLPKSLLVKLQRVQNAVARLIVGVGKYEHISNNLRLLHWLPVEEHVLFKTALMTFRCLNNTAPSYLSSQTSNSTNPNVI